MALAGGTPWSFSAAATSGSCAIFDRFSGVMSAQCCATSSQLLLLFGGDGFECLQEIPRGQAPCSETDSEQSYAPVDRGGTSQCEHGYSSEGEKSHGVGSWRMAVAAAVREFGHGRQEQGGGPVLRSGIPGASSADEV
ncbi:hypothetical protein B0H17DRAFT_1132015 [Mycena rosella]|uniref:Uncharacterized protein n=1 Tax=Mycena rosella TaxID=1033263 RepID=A0AAD7GH28_MYCRO|nr:hypothetical protein B0H17DRAFT_1132015 [Mycena rosella]